MTAIYPTAAGNWSTRTWNVCSTGLAYGTTPQVSDDIYCNNVAITIDQDIIVNSLNNAANGSAAAGGLFTVATSHTLTVNSAIMAAAATCLFLAATGTVILTGSALVITGGSSANAAGVSSNSTGVVRIDATIVGGSASGAYGVSFNSATCNVTINGNITGGTNTGHGVSAIRAATAVVNGNVSGGAGSGQGISIAATFTSPLTVNGNVVGSATGVGVTTLAAVIITVNGNVTGGGGINQFGVNIGGAGTTVIVNGTITGGSSIGGYGISSGLAATIIANGPVVAASAQAIVASVTTVFVQITNGPITNNVTNGVNAIYSQRLAISSAFDWTFAGAGTPPAYSGTFTIGDKSSGRSSISIR